MTMPMCHKAYAFDWAAFKRGELPRLLHRALETGDPSDLIPYVERYRGQLKNPYEGEPLGVDSQEMLENRDVHEYGDYALTRFYDQGADRGLGPCWADIDDALPREDREALLGSPFGPEHNRFDPDRYGSYFQTPLRVAGSLARVRGLGRLRLEGRDRPFVLGFADLVEGCVAGGLWLYVTF